MKLTDTQKEFRRQIKDLKPIEDPYDNSRKANPFGKVNKRVAISSGLIVSIAITVISLLLRHPIQFTPGNQATAAPTTERQPASSASSNTQTPPKEQASAPQSSPTPSVSPSVNTKKNISQKDAYSLNQMNTILNELNTVAENISQLHRTLLDTSNNQTYKTALSNGIVTCDKENRLILQVNCTDTFKPLQNILQNISTNSRYAYDYYLNYTNTNSSSDIDIGNKYFSLANNNRKEYITTLTAIFDKNNYNYTITNGNISYTIDNY